MLEYHGWINIRGKAYFVEDDNMDEIVEKIQNYIDNNNWNNGLMSLYPTNGEYFLHFSGFHNHNYSAPHVNLFMEFIADVAQESYGIVYLYDDEAQDIFENKFKVLVLKRGGVTEQADPFLSPYFPEVEDIPME
jgi:hypothetical protein